MASSTSIILLLRKYLESHLLSNYHQDLKTQTCLNQWQGFEFHPTTSSSFKNAFDISNSIPLFSKVFAMSYLLWNKYYCYLRIKNPISAIRSLYKYIWEIVVYIVLTGTGHLRPNIRPKTPQQASSIESMMRITWNTKAI